MKSKIEYFQSKRNKNYYFRIVAKNGETVAQSEGYTTKAMRTKGLKSLIKILSTPTTQILEKFSKEGYAVITIAQL